jgi:hypothetical protein
MGSRQAPAVDRFAEKVALTESGCFEWIASLNNTGYGTFAIGGGRSTVAHRWSYEYHVGPIPDGLHLDHLCRNRRCVNPDHLEPVTISENLLRGIGVGQSNTTKTHCPAGHSYTEDNTYYAPSRLNRMCRTCRRNRGNRNEAKAAA